MNTNLQFGITKVFPCSYLDNQQEKLLVAIDPRLNNNDGYELLMTQGFRRSGDQVYRPHCDNCNACQSIRINCQDYLPSKSQKRLEKKNHQLLTKVSTSVQKDYYPLYALYINTLHKDGTMYPANKEQYKSFLTSALTEQIFIEIWDDKTLVSVAVTDILPHALSAVYTFYHPEYRSQGIGVFSIIKQIEVCLKKQKEFLYLGYQIDDCQKMNYKSKFYPHQRLVDNSWQTINK